MKKVYSCGDAKIIVSENGVIEKTENLYSIMWWNEILNSEIIGKHITYFADLLKKYRRVVELYNGFVEKVLPDFCEYVDEDRNKTLNSYVKKDNKIVN